MKKSLINLFRKPLEQFIQTASASGIVLAFCAALAMLLANSSFSDTYFNLLETKFAFLSLQHWINDGLMTIFFLVVGLEIKREIVSGELSTLKKASLPVAAALGGMLVPALVYFYFNNGSPNLSGWAIPMATDIAFALGVLTLFGSRVPLSLKVFLLALAIVDDLGAVLVIAFFYTSQIKLLGLLAAAIAFILVLAARHFRVTSYTAYVVLGVGVWAGFLYSGVHATIAGVLLGLLTPNIFSERKNQFATYSPINEIIHFLHSWVSFGIMPIFALANAGVALKGVDLSTVFAHPIFDGVSLGLTIGKPVGILLFSGLAVLIGVAKLADDLKWVHIFGASTLAGIGFTMSVFIANLALPTDTLIYAKVGIIIASVTAAILGSLILWIGFRLTASAR